MELDEVSERSIIWLHENGKTSAWGGYASKASHCNEGLRCLIAELLISKVD